MISSFTFHDPTSKSGKTLKNKIKDDDAATQSLADLVTLLSIQIEKLGHITTQRWPPVDQKLNSQTAHLDGSYILVDPFGHRVPRLYEELIQREPILVSQDKQQQQHCCCCRESSVIAQAHGVAAAAGVPWPRPQQGLEEEDPLQAAYTHWCTLMRCLPMMEPTSQTYVQTIGQFAMRRLLQAMQTKSSSTATLGNVSEQWQVIVPSSACLVTQRFLKLSKPSRS
ncbi:hypothetical protein BX666DRAFT_2025079 [Dichotomocladium elegans]|nr:hypothetical protein BX666DRAFT_2025079 [Dichotomocladium elegans]